MDAGFLLAGSAAETGRRGLSLWRHFVENGLEEVRRVFFDEGVSSGRVEGMVSDFVQTLHLLKVSAGNRNGFVFLCKQVDLLLQFRKRQCRLAEIVEIHPMHDCLRYLDIFLILTAEVTSLPLMCKLKTRDLLSQSIRHFPHAFIILFLLFVDPALQTTLDDFFLGLHQSHHSVYNRVVGFQVEFGLEDAGGDPDYHGDYGCRFAAVSEIVLPQQLVKPYPISLAQVNADASFVGLRPIHWKIEPDLARKQTAYHFHRISILMGHITLRVFFNHTLAGKLKEVVLPKRVEERQILQKLKLLLVGFPAQHFLHIHHCLLPFSLHNGQFLVDMETTRQSSLHSQHLAISPSSIQHLTGCDLSTSLILSLLFPQVTLQQHVVIAFADETKSFAQDERMQGLKKKDQVI